MSKDVLTFTAPDGVSKEQVQREADRLGYASVNQYLIDLFEHREEVVGDRTRVERLEDQLKRYESRITDLEERVDELEATGETAAER